MNELSEDLRIRASVEEILANGTWADYDGDAIRSLIALLSQKHHRKWVQLCCSGTIAVELALRGLKIGSGDEVILAGYDFPGNFRAIEALGALPVLIDISEDSWSLDPDLLDQAFSEKVKAIIVSHLHGTFAKMSSIINWAKERGIFVVEDACQAHGAVLEGRPVGSWGDISVFSFGGSKLISSGRGGAILTDHDLIAQRMKIYRDRGNDAYPMSQLQACVVGPQWEFLAEKTEKRWSAVQQLEAILSQSDHFRFADRIYSPSDLPAFYKWGFRVRGKNLQETERNRRRILEWMEKHRVPAGEGFRGFQLRSSNRCRTVGDLPNTVDASQGTILVHHKALLEQDCIQEMLDPHHGLASFWKTTSN